MGHEMSEVEREILHDQLIEANRAMITLETIDLQERTTQTSPAIRECMQAYAYLLRSKVTMPLSPDESVHIQEVLDCLSAQLRAFGEDV